MRQTLILVSIVLCGWYTPQADAQEVQNTPKIEVIPAPKQMILPPPAAVPSTIHLPERPLPGTREVWQYYGVDAFGRFRPRVILAPYGSYDYRTLQPYPWVPNRSTRFMPYVVD